MDMTAEEHIKEKLIVSKADWVREMEEYASIKTKELEKQLQKEAMKHLSLLDQIKELEDKNQKLYNELIDCSTANIDFQSEIEEVKEENKSLKELINDIWEITHGFGDNLNDERVEKIYDLIDEKFNQH